MFVSLLRVSPAEQQTWTFFFSFVEVGSPFSVDHCGALHAHNSGLFATVIIWGGRAVA